MIEIKQNNDPNDGYLGDVLPSQISHPRVHE